LRLHGFAGLTLGFQLALNLFEKYGINLYPQPEENEGLEWQVRALSGLNGEEIDGSLIEPIMNVPVTNQPVYAMWHYLQANEIAKIADSARRSRRLERGGIALEDYMQALNATSLEQLNKLQLQLKQAQEAHIQLTEKLSNIYKDSAPPSSHIAYALASYQQNLTQLIDLRQQSMDLEHEHHDVEDASVDSVTAIQKNHYTRQSAIRELLVIADFIRANEPHSPLPYMLARVVEWAQLPLPQLLPKMIKNTAELDQVFALTGIKPESVTT
jgi:type VI secretion system protein ImpA